LGIKDVLITLNNLVKLGIIKDYAVGGGYAVMYYDIPVTTYDLDVLVILPSEDDFHKLYEHFRRNGNKIEDVYIFIGDMPVQFLPNYISPLFNSAIEESNVIEFEGVSSKFVSMEYLIALLLTSFRPKDKIRIGSLLNRADIVILLDIIKRFDNDQNQLFGRYQRILAESREGS